MEKESPKQHLWCPCSIHYNAKSDRILHGKYFLLQQNHIFMIEKVPILYNSLIISTYEIEKRKRVTIWLLLKFPGLP